eukprot:Hpha_TRINITY_DN7080_c0_g1::TRINITY_DN7080_c0_g1_i1::g.23030::m.23030
MHLPSLFSSYYLRSEPFRLANGQYGRYEFYDPFVIAQSSYATRKAHILVIYCARLASRSFAILEDEDDDDFLDDDLSEQDPDLNIEYETFFFVSAAKTDGLLHHGLQQVLQGVQLGKEGGTQRVFIQSDGEFRNRHNFAWLGKT